MSHTVAKIKVIFDNALFKRCIKLCSRSSMIASSSSFVGSSPCVTWRHSRSPSLDPGPEKSSACLDQVTVLQDNSIVVAAIIFPLDPWVGNVHGSPMTQTHAKGAIIWVSCWGAIGRNWLRIHCKEKDLVKSSCSSLTFADYLDKPRPGFEWCQWRSHFVQPRRRWRRRQSGMFHRTFFYFSCYIDLSPHFSGNPCVWNRKPGLIPKASGAGHRVR